MKTERVHPENELAPGWLIFCPGCGLYHVISDRFYFNDKPDRPSWMPPVVLRSGVGADATVCSFIVTNGQIKYAADSTHAMRGKTAELPDL
jgi:hypothetical protein